MGKAHSNKGRLFRFNNSEELERFILLYEDLFTPYSLDVLKYKKKYHDDISDLERGFERMRYGNILKEAHLTEEVFNNDLKVNLTKENLDKILNSESFTKERFMRGRFIFVMKKES